MNRRNERIVVGVLGLISAAISLYIGLHFFTSGGGTEVAVIGTEGAAVDGAVDGASATPAGSDAGSEPTTSLPADDGGPAIVVTSTTAVAETSTSLTTSASSSSTTTTQATSSSTSSTTAQSTETTASSSTTEATTTTVPTTASTTTTTEATTTTTAPSTSTSTAPTTTTAPVLTITEIEREILRLTNELRTDPSGPLRRQGEMPECEDSNVEFDPATGHPKPVPALRLSEPVSVYMARDWSQKMADADEMSHRSSESQSAVYAALGIDWAARGENVAWAVGYQPSAIAQLFFNGWRESAGHYCNMMSGSFTHIGIGHVRTDAGKDFATQNLYRPR